MPGVAAALRARYLRVEAVDSNIRLNLAEREVYAGRKNVDEYINANNHYEDCALLTIQGIAELRGHCVECVSGHRKHQKHLPECMQPILRGLVAHLAAKVEYGVVERRPKPQE